MDRKFRHNLCSMPANIKKKYSFDSQQPNTCLPDAGQPYFTVYNYFYNSVQLLWYL